MVAASQNQILIGFNPAEEKTILETIKVNLRSFNTQWDEHFT
jgi:hypothetical protein